MTNIFINLITYNSTIETINCLLSIDKLNTKGMDLHVTVIDNASKKEFVCDKKFENFDLHTIVNKENQGFSGGHNKGIKYALQFNPDYVIILNNDTYLDKNLLTELVIVAKSDEKIGIVGPKIYFAKGHEFHKERYKKSELGNVIWYGGGIIDWKNIILSHRFVDEIDTGQLEITEETDFVSGCCMLINVDVLRKIGMFDERYFLYLEDSDFNIRAKKEGYKIVFAPKAKMWHINAASAGGSGSVLQDYFVTRNRLLFGMTYAKLRTKIALLRESLGLLKNGREWQKKGVMDYFMRRFYKGSYSE